MTKSVLWSSCSRLSCSNAESPDVVLCLTDSSLINDTDCERTTLDAVLTKNWKDCNGCNTAVYRYLFAYDENDLTDPTIPLTTAQVEGVFCKGCLTDWVQDEIHCAGGFTCLADTTTLDLNVNEEGCAEGVVQISEDSDNILSVSSDGLFVPAPTINQPEYIVRSESDLIDAISINANMVIVDDVTLTDDRTTTTSVRVITGGSFITDGNILTLNGPFSSGAFQCFDSSVGEVVFGINSTFNVFPEWFGAVGNGIADDTSAMQLALNAAAIFYIPIQLKGQKIYLVSTLTLPTRTTIICENYWNTGSRIRGSAANTLLDLAGGEYIKIKGVIVDGNNVSTSLIKFAGASYCEIEDCIVLNGSIGIDHSGGGIVNNFLRCKVTGTFSSCGVNISSVSNHLLFESCRFQISAGAATNDILTDTSWTGDLLIIRNCTFESQNTLVDSVKMVHPISYPGIQFIIEGNRWDGAKTNSLVYISQYSYGVVRNNSFAGTCPTPIFCDGIFCQIDANYVTNSTVAGISLGANSQYCHIGPQLWGGIAPFIANIGLNNEVYNRFDYGTYSFYNKPLKGITADRPTMPAGIYSPTAYLDTTLDADGKPIWWNGVAWVDATGAVV